MWSTADQSRLIAEGSGEDEDVDMELRRYAATQYYALLAKPMLPDILMQIVCWVLGEYGYLCRDADLESISERLCDTIERQFAQDEKHRHEENPGRNQPYRCVLAEPPGICLC